VVNVLTRSMTSEVNARAFGVWSAVFARRGGRTPSASSVDHVTTRSGDAAAETPADVHRMRKTVFVGMLVALLALMCAPASIARAPDVSLLSSPGRVSFLGSPGRVFQGQRTTFHALVSPGNASCRLSIKYKGGKVQRLERKSAVGGQLSWTVRIPAVPAGAATATASCARVGTAMTSLQVEWALQAPKVTIARKGFSQRPHKYDAGSDVNYGLEVHNERLRFDATNVTLLVNMVDSTNRVLGTGFVRIPRLPAGSVFNVGGQTAIPTQTPVSRLEVVVNATSDQKLLATPVLISDMIIAPLPYDPVAVGSVRGQLLNQSPVPMDSGVVGVVIEDANGNIIGGGLGYASGPLSHGAREAFDARGPFNAIPIASAAKAVVSAIPNYRLTP
jgi:hypothetical protein